MSGFIIKPATRQAVIPMIGMYGKSGSGKTFSALMLARGLVGPKGRISVLDTENRRASLCADLIPGGYDVLDFDPPFSPDRYAEALEQLISQSDVVIVDSLSHEHDGEGGVLEMQEAELQRMAGDDYRKREACKMAAWIKPKMRHKIFIQKLLRSNVPLICCLRGQEKTHVVKGDDGKNKVVTDEFSTPIFDHRFIFELLCNIETVMVNDKPGFGVIRKWSHPDLLKCLPKGNEQISIAHGESIARWCQGGVNMAGTAPTPKPDAERNALAVQLWKLLEPIHKGFKDALPAVEQSLWDSAMMQTDERLGTLPVERMRTIIEKLKAKATTTAQPQLV